MAKRASKKKTEDRTLPNVVREIRCDLTPQDEERLIRHAYDLTSRIKTRKQHIAEQRRELRDMTDELERTVETFHQGFEMRDMECVQEISFAENAVRVKRKDTGELVEERAITAEERERWLPFPEAGPAAGQDAPAPN